MAVADDLSDAVRLAAIRDALDRAGLSGRAGVDVQIAARPFEQIFTNAEAGSRAAYRASIGRPEPESPALAGQPAESHSDDEVLDAQIATPRESFASRS